MTGGAHSCYNESEQEGRLIILQMNKIFLVVDVDAFKKLKRIFTTVACTIVTIEELNTRPSALKSGQDQSQGYHPSSFLCEFAHP